MKESKRKSDGGEKGMRDSGKRSEKTKARMMEESQRKREEGRREN